MKTFTFALAVCAVLLPFIAHAEDKPVSTNPFEAVVVDKTAPQATTANVVMVSRLMYTASNVMSRKVYEDHGGVQVVFRRNGLRYTFYCPANKESNFLSVWVRKENTSGQDSLLTFSDDDLNGSVDFGIGGPKNGTDDEKKYFRIEDGHNHGAYHKPYWQSLYNMAIKDALTVLGYQPKQK